MAEHEISSFKNGAAASDLIIDDDRMFTVDRTDQLDRLANLAAPAALGRAVERDLEELAAESNAGPAPRELDWRVALRTLEHLPAPSELDARVRAELEG